MNRIYVYPYDQLSEGAGAVAKALDTQKLLRKKSKYKAQEGDVLVNWGASDFHSWLGLRDGAGMAVCLNNDISATLDKRLFFHTASGSAYIPEWATDRRIAEATLRFPILCRTKVKGKDGEGIVIADSKIDMVDAPLYVQLENKTQEYRVHVGRNRDGSTSIIGVCQKLRPNGFVGGDNRIRNGENGNNFYWTVKGLPVVLPDQCRLAVLDVFKRFDLDFGGVDVIYDSNRDKAFVLEINTAPEMTPKAAELYAEFFQQFRQPRVAPAKDMADYHDRIGEFFPAAAFDKWKAEGVDALPVRPDPVKDAFEAWVDTQVEGNDPFYRVLMLQAFKAGWAGRKEAEYAAVYGLNKAREALGGDPLRIDVV